MAKKGPKVKELARELGVTSRRIIDYLRAEGVPVQNSVTRLAPPIERVVREGLGSGDADHPPRDESAPTD